VRAPFFLFVMLFTMSGFIFPHGALAQDRDTVRAQARSTAQQLRALGEPKDRCSIGAYFQDGGTIVDVFRDTPLQQGDLITKLHGTDTSSMSTEQIGAVLRETAPDARIPVTIRRGNENLTFEVPCSNSRPAFETVLAGLDQAGRGRWDECVRTFASRTDLSFLGAQMRFSCASLSRSSGNHDIGQLAIDVSRMMINIGRWIPSRRPAVLTQLRALEGTISRSRGAAAFQELVNETRQWEGGENAWERSEPDWTLFRRNAEAALRGRLIDPESAHIEWPHGFLLGSWRPLFGSRVEGYWTCGLINARNRMGGYTGATAFVVVLSPEGDVRHADVGSARDVDLLSNQCARSISLLPPPPQALLTTAPAQQAASGQHSIADELERLVRLRDSGAITQAEFDAAKARLLAESSD
jgi:hypothetical protein